ncbi:MAG: metal-dependent hydrolase [Anaerolineales bacterium]|nr:metal-dependent hydrolase [Anaerolineales bacterium]
MQTYSHFLMTAVLNDGLKSRGLPVHTKALLFGSFMPDVPLFLLTLGYVAYRAWIDPRLPGEHIFGPRYDNLYFHHPLWITGHNLFHAPVLIALMLGVGYYLGLRQQKKWGVALFWFAVACGFHSLVDIFTHHDDGPLLFFPFNWDYRFSAPISYWDSRYGGRIFAPLEHLLDLAILVYFAVAWALRRKLLKGKETI